MLKVWCTIMMDATVALAVVLLTLVLYAPKNAAKNGNKHYIACCDIGLDADDKDMCKWMTEKGVTRLYRGESIYEGVWTNCKPGEEPWRKWE